MPTRFACPNCRAEYPVAVPPASGMVRCKYCQTETALAPAKPASNASVPMLEESMTRRPPAPTPPPATRKRPDAPARSATANPAKVTRSQPDAPSHTPEVPSHRNLYFFVGGGAAALVVAVAAIFFITRDPSTLDPNPGPITLGKDKGPDQPPDLPKAKIDDKDKVVEIILKTPPELPPENHIKKPELKKEPTKSEAPLQIAAAATQKVKQSTAYLKVTLPNGEVAEGSGFFALAPGLVVSNAHVVGMLRGKEKPKEVEVVVHSGEPEEFRRQAQVLGVDQANDLAILRINGETDGLPTPLTVEFASSLAELQKVYIFGFPFGSRLGKNITVSESSISSLRKGPDGLKDIQVNGGMHPGNSGGPVVDTRGVVIGVAVAGIRGTQINFAVPGAKIRGLLDGRVQETRIGEPYLADKQATLPFSLTCLDPLGRIKKIRLDLWTGLMGPARPTSLMAPMAEPDDGPRQSFDLPYSSGIAKGEIALPAAEVGQVYWLQPVLMNEAGEPQWGTATPFQPSGPPLKRVPARLALKYANGLRTIELRCQSQLQLSRGSENLKVLDVIDTEALETVEMQASGAGIRMQLGRCDFTQEVNGRSLTRHPSAHALMQRLPYSCLVTRQGMMLKRGLPGIPSGNSEVIREETEDMAHFFSNAYEMSALPLPDRVLQPLSSWEANMPFMLLTGKKRDTAILKLTCTYEGARTVNKQSHAFARLAGEVRFRDNPVAQGRVEGTALINLAAGYVAKINVIVKTEVERGETFSVSTLDTQLSRVEGNPRKIMPAPKIASASVNLAGARALINKTGVLNEKDPVDPRGRVGCRHKVVPVRLAAGKTYVIDLKKTPGSMLDPFLRLETAKGVPLAQDDDSGGQLDARIVYRPTVAGTFRIVVTSFAPNQLGEYLLSLSELR